jgi:hemoglobin
VSLPFRLPIVNEQPPQIADEPETEGEGRLEYDDGLIAVAGPSGYSVEHVVSTQTTSLAALKAPGIAAGITEPIIHDVVHAFYTRVRNDEVLGPIFQAKIEDWPLHLEKMCAFWSSITLMSGRYKGRPMVAHAKIPGIDRAHFGRWLVLFRETANEICAPAAALLFADRAERIAQSLQIGIALHRSHNTPEEDRT